MQQDHNSCVVGVDNLHAHHTMSVVNPGKRGFNLSFSLY